jgi:hypothetical protein
MIFDEFLLELCCFDVVVVVVVVGSNWNFHYNSYPRFGLNKKIN